MRFGAGVWGLELAVEVWNWRLGFGASFVLEEAVKVQSWWLGFELGAWIWWYGLRAGGKGLGWK